jgi:hypothetical protein
MKIFETRNDILDKLPKKLRIVELGVFRGEFAEEIFTRMNPKELYLVDIWSGSFGSGDKDGNNHTVIDNMENVFFGLRDKYKFESTVHVIKKNTVDFLNSCSDNSFDMIYVDADHTYSAVTNDLELSFSKLKNTGILCGHDYIQGSEIQQAVDNFCYKYKQKIVAITKDGCPTFLIQINKNNL